MDAGDAPTGRPADLLRLLKPTPGRLEFAFRLALISALTTLVAEIYQIPFAALSAYVLLFFNKPDRVGSLIMNVGALIAVTVLIALIFPLADVVMDAPLWRVVSMVLVSLVILFLASGREVQAIGGIITLVIVFALSLMGMLPLGEVATRGLLYGWLIIALPAMVSIVVNLALAPAPRKLASRAIAQRLRVTAARLVDDRENSRRHFRVAVDSGDEEIRKWLKFAALEHTSPAADIQALQRANDSIVQIMTLADVATHEAEAALPEVTRQQVAALLTEMAASLDSGGYPVDIQVEALRDEPSSLPPQAATLLTELCDAMTGFAEPIETQETGRQAEQQSGQQSTQQSIGAGEEKAEAETGPDSASAQSLRPGLFDNPQHIRYAVKTTGAAMLCYLLYTLLDWPGIHTCMITCYIVALGTTAETAQKLTLRMIGCVIGGIVGIAAILFVVPLLHSVPGLVAVVFIGMLGSAWIAVGSPRIAYAGFQIGFAFLLCVLQGWGPGFDLSIARDRIIGVLIGNLVVYLVFTNVWPISVTERIDPAIAAVLRQLRRLLDGADRATRLAGLALAQAGLGHIKQDLGLIGYEPAALRPDVNWVRQRRHAARDLSALQRLLAVQAVHSDSAQAATTAAGLEQLAHYYETGASASPSKTDETMPTPVRLGGHDSLTDSPFASAITARLRRLKISAAAGRREIGVPKPEETSPHAV